MGFDGVFGSLFICPSLLCGCATESLSLYCSFVGRIFIKDILEMGCGIIIVVVLSLLLLLF